MMWTPRKPKRKERRFFTTFSPALRAGLLLGIVTIQAATTQAGERIIKPVRSIVVDDTVWPHFNWASFDQDKVVSYGHYQYTVYWDADKVLVVVRRDLRNHQVQVLRLSSHTLTIAPRDGHRNAVLGVSGTDGRLHLSWDHHNNDLRYTKSHKNFLTQPPGEMSVEDFEPAQPLAPVAPQRVTYPRFLNDGQGRLYFVYRSGGSGNGRNVFCRYDATRGTWQVAAGRLFGSEGTYSPWNNSTSRNAYLNGILFDKNNRLHVTWTYREVAASWASNHDLHYAYSEDFGVTWMNNEGQHIADLSQNDAIDIGDPGIVVQNIPVYSWLMNQCAMTLDSKDQPHVALFRLPDTFKPAQLQHNPPPDVKARLRFYHYWRDPDGAWHNSGPLPMPKGLIVKRPEILADNSDAILIYWATDQGFYGYVANASDHWKNTKLLRLTGPEFTSGDACKHDRYLLKEKGILSFTADPKGAREGKGYAILDFDIGKFRSPTP